VVFPDDIDYAVAVRGENKVLFINTASRRVVDSITDGIGDSPFSVVVAPGGRLAFVNNTASHDISVIDVALREVIARIPVGEQPIVMAVHPSGETLWVSSEGSHELAVVEIPDAWRAVPQTSVSDEPT
jgi:YVTN family beta-propeller protein